MERNRNDVNQANQHEKGVAKMMNRDKLIQLLSEHQVYQKLSEKQNNEDCIIYYDEKMREIEHELIEKLNIEMDSFGQIHTIKKELQR